MGDQTGIQWTAKTYNPWQGCDRVSPGCDNCYMFRDMRRFGKEPEVVVRSSPQTFNRPLRWNREAKAAGRVDMVFLASWSDFFHKDADAWRDEAWAIIRQCDSLIFQILTKRHGRIESHLPADWANGYKNVWLGVSAENLEWWERRVPVLDGIPAYRKFVSYEPAIGSIKGASAAGMDWVIIGGESAPGRPFDLAWAREAIAICRRDGAAPFVKQLGSFAQDPINGVVGAMTKIDESVAPLVSLRLKDRAGGDMDEWPEDLRVREFPR
jgi:protein gp37